MSNKVIVAKTGFNALTETDPDNLIFSSDYNTLKYDTLGIIQMTVNFADYYASTPYFLGTIYYHYKVVEVTHNLGYVPFFIGYLLNYPTAGSDVQLPIFSADAFSYASLQCYADSTKLYFMYDSGLADVNSGTATIDLKYRIFKNRLSL